MVWNDAIWEWRSMNLDRPVRRTRDGHPAGDHVSTHAGPKPFLPTDPLIDRPLSRKAERPERFGGRQSPSRLPIRIPARSIETQKAT
jgi:hypothetical protein